MAITSLTTTCCAPVSVAKLTPLTGYNTVWISGDRGETIHMALSGGGAFGGPGGGASQTLELDGNGQGQASVCALAADNGPALVVLAATDATGAQWRRPLQFAPLVPGPGKFLWYGAAVGAGAGGGRQATIFVAIDQTTDLGAMRLVAARAMGAGLIRVDGVTGDGKIQQVDADGCAAIQAVDPLPETVTVRASLPESADGEVLFVNCPFVAEPGGAEMKLAEARQRAPAAVGEM